MTTLFHLTLDRYKRWYEIIYKWKRMIFIKKISPISDRFLAGFCWLHGYISEDRHYNNIQIQTHRFTSDTHILFCDGAKRICLTAQHIRWNVICIWEFRGHSQISRYLVSIHGILYANEFHFFETILIQMSFQIDLAGFKVLNIIKTGAKIH